MSWSLVYPKEPCSSGIGWLRSAIFLVGNRVALRTRGRQTEGGGWSPASPEVWPPATGEALVGEWAGMERRMAQVSKAQTLRSDRSSRFQAT